MEFDKLVQYLGKALKETLPGTDTQWEMASSDRRMEDYPRQKKAGTKPAAVLILLYPSGGSPYTIFIRRPVYDGVHSGQISFPGGKKEDGDKSLAETAIRETCEEIGICSDELKIIGRLTPLYIPVSDIEVSPYVAVCNKKPALKPDSEEVVSVIEARLGDFFDPGIVKEAPMEIRDEVIRVKYYDYEGHVIWGASAMILHELLVLIRLINPLRGS